METLNLNLLVQVLVCFLVLAVVFYVTVKQRPGSVGLTMAYLLSLAVNHWFGGLIHALPWYVSSETRYVITGFYYCFLGVICFAVGSLVVAPLLVKASWRARPTPAAMSMPLRLPETLLIMGIVFYFVLFPLLSFIPSMTAVTVAGVNFVIVGFCLAFFRSVKTGHRAHGMFWLMATCSMPVVTVAAQGFLGYGMVALLAVLAFASYYYRPRWQLVLGGVLALYAGLSLFVNYMRERSMIRQAVWTNQEFTERFDRIAAIFTQFEWFSFRDEAHLRVVDERLNQNRLVGCSEDYIESGFTDFARGETLWHSLVAIIPRIIWPDKPAIGGGRGIVSRYTGIMFSEGTSVGVGHVMEFYINFGTAGVVVGFLLMGILVRICDMTAAHHLLQGDYGRFALWYLPALSTLGTGWNLSELTGTFAASIVTVLLVNRFVLHRLHQKPHVKLGAPIPGVEVKCAEVREPS